MKLQIQNRIMNFNFGKAAKRVVLAAFLIVILGGAAVGVTYRTQINEMISYHQTYDERETGASHDSGTNTGNQLYKNDNEKAFSHHHEHGGFIESARITEPSAGAKIILGIYGLLCLLAGITYWVLIAAWLYQAAEKSSMNGLLWAVLGIFLNLVAVIVFLLLRRRKRACPSCSRYQDDAEYCRFCGVPMKHKCGECGTVTELQDVYCPHCGSMLNQ